MEILELIDVNYAAQFIDMTKSNLEEIVELKIKGDSKDKYECSTTESSMLFNFDKLETIQLTECSPFFGMILRNCKNLKKLHLGSSRRLENVPNNKFRLEELHLSEYSSLNFDSEKQNLINFLQIHKETLKVLELDTWPCLPVLKLVFSMPNLQKLQLFELAKFNKSTNWDEVELPVNISINDLEIEDLTDDKRLLECMLKSCRNIKKLKLHKLTDDIMQLVSIYAPTAETRSDFFIDEISREVVQI